VRTPNPTPPKHPSAPTIRCGHLNTVECKS
jgi:hypothetical protein